MAEKMIYRITYKHKGTKKEGWRDYAFFSDKQAQGFLQGMKREYWISSIKILPKKLE